MTIRDLDSKIDELVEVLDNVYNNPTGTDKQKANARDATQYLQALIAYRSLRG